MPDFYSQVYKRFRIDEDGVGIDLSTTGCLLSREVAAVSLQDELILSVAQFNAMHPQAMRFIEDSLRGKMRLRRASWLRVNYDDDAINNCVGIGGIDFQQNWQLFVLTSLSTIRAEEGGDTAMVLFDSYFDWSVHFNLSQYKAELAVEVYQRQYSASLEAG